MVQRRRDEGRPAGSPLVPPGPDLGAGPLAHPHRFHELSLNSLSSLNWLTSRYGLFNLIPPRQRRDGPLPSPWSRCYLGFASDTPAPWRRDEAHPAAASVGWWYFLRLAEAPPTQARWSPTLRWSLPYRHRCRAGHLSTVCRGSGHPSPRRLPLQTDISPSGELAFAHGKITT